MSDFTEYRALSKVMRTGVRMWVNQPSTSQPHHNLHGLNVIAFPLDKNTVQVFFTSTHDLVAMEMSPLSLSNGWLKSQPSL